MQAKAKACEKGAESALFTFWTLRRREQFATEVRKAFDEKTAELTDEMGRVSEEAEALREKQRQTIARLEPKLETLAELRQKAAEIAEANAPKPVG